MHGVLIDLNPEVFGTPVTLSWDDQLTSRDDLLQALARGGFRPATA